MSVSKRIALDNDPGLIGRIRTWIEQLSPYQSLALLAVPTCLVEPLKLIAVAVAGDGHWITGTCMIVAAYAISLLVLERLFLVVKPKLLTLPWFARIWRGFVSIRTSVLTFFGWQRTDRALE